MLDVGALRLLIGLAYAVKHELRGEHGFHYKDLQDLLPGVEAACDFNQKTKLNRILATLVPMTPTSVLRNRGAWRDPSVDHPDTRAPPTTERTPLLPRRFTSRMYHEPGNTSTDATGVVAGVNSSPTGARTPSGKRAETHQWKDPVCKSDYSCGCFNLPLLIINHLSFFNVQALKEDTIPAAMYSSLHLQLNACVENITGMDRILSTRIPHAYGLHLRQVLTLYCLVLPFQIMQGMGWHTPGVMALIAFILFGIESLGLEIENPFGYDPNDLPLDRYCDVIRSEIEEYIHLKPEYALDPQGKFDADGLLADLDRDEHAFDDDGEGSTADALQDGPPASSVVNAGTGVTGQQATAASTMPTGQGALETTSAADTDSHPASGIVGM
ncbi:hypothetical protein HK101_011241 [Irineochytrium annulatum]|nr:hypothetical protein HK101_011241 [Irineochytrium annulatum]